MRRAVDQVKWIPNFPERFDVSMIFQQLYITMDWILQVKRRLKRKLGLDQKALALVKEQTFSMAADRRQHNPACTQDKVSLKFKATSSRFIK